jgi:hypothetical protein
VNVVGMWVACKRRFERCIVIMTGKRHVQMLGAIAASPKPAAHNYARVHIIHLLTHTGTFALCSVKDPRHSVVVVIIIVARTLLPGSSRNRRSVVASMECAILVLLCCCCF